MRRGSLYSSRPWVSCAVLERDRSDSARLSVVERWLFAAVGGGLSVMLGLALWLTPSTQGLGTHQQLGLPPCSIIQLLGTRCPACGMTTSWAYLVRGQVWAACQANVGGVLLGFWAIIGAPWLLGSACQGRWWGWTPTERAVLLGGIATFAVIMADWFARR